jgi:integrase
MMISAGENPMRVAKQMGHVDWTMIAKVYGKWMPDAQDKAVAAFCKTTSTI